MDSIDKINKILAEKGMTGADLSRLLDVSNSTYSNWNTKKNKIKPINLLRIASVLNVDVAEIRGDDLSEAQDQTAQKTENSADDMEETLEHIRNNPGMRILFSKAKHATPEQLLAIAQMIDTFKKGE